MDSTTGPPPSPRVGGADQLGADVDVAAKSLVQLGSATEVLGGDGRPSHLLQQAIDLAGPLSQVASHLHQTFRHPIRSSGSIEMRVIQAL